MTIKNEQKVRALLAAGKSSESILDYLVMNDDYRTKSEARPILEQFMAENNLTKVKQKPMSEQYEDWYRALPLAEKRTMDKTRLRAKAVEIGMSDKSADWYARVYALAGALALSIYDEAHSHQVKSLMTTLEEHGINQDQYNEAPKPEGGEAPAARSGLKTEAEVKAELKADPEYNAWYKALSAKAKKAWMAAETGTYTGDYSEECFKNADGIDHLAE